MGGRRESLVGPQQRCVSRGGYMYASRPVLHRHERKKGRTEEEHMVNNSSRVREER